MLFSDVHALSNAVIEIRVGNDFPACCDHTRFHSLAEIHLGRFERSVTLPRDLVPGRKPVGGGICIECAAGYSDASAAGDLAEVIRLAAGDVQRAVVFDPIDRGRVAAE